MEVSFFYSEFGKGKDGKHTLFEIILAFFQLICYTMMLI